MYVYYIMQFYSSRRFTSFVMRCTMSSAVRPLVGSAIVLLSSKSKDIQN